jgi:outer membrane protein assembly factor BamA
MHHSKFEMQSANATMRRAVFVLHLALCLVNGAATQVAAQNAPAAQDVPSAPTITDVRVEQEGQVVTDPQILGLVETKVGNPLSIADVRESINHLIGLNRYDDVQVFSDASPNGVRVRYVLLPLHPIDRVAFRGMTGMDPDELRRLVTQRYGIAPAASRAPVVADFLKATYQNHGYSQPKIMWHVEPTHMPDRATLVFDVESGERAVISDVRFEQVDPREQTLILGWPQLKTGRSYDSDAIDKQLEDYVDNLRGRGYYEARASHTVMFDGKQAIVTVQLARGPRVVLAFAGDPIPEKERDRLVPIRTEGSVDQDLLEDSQNAITDYLHSRGYRDAHVEYTEEEQAEQLTITFHVARGPRYDVSSVMITGNMALPTMDLQQAVRIRSGDPFVQAAVDRGVASIRNMYRLRGFTQAMAQATISVLPTDSTADPDRQVDVRLAITEGAKTTVRAVSFAGNASIPEADLRTGLSTIPNTAYNDANVAADRDRIELEYRNRGYDSVVVQPNVTFADDNSRADVRFMISEGPQAIVDHIIIVGNERTKPSTIERELLLKPGEPLGYSARIESQQRLSALGLFRRVRITDLQHGGEAHRDVMVEVEEAPATTISEGGGIEVGTRLRSDVEGGAAVERYEFVPRAFFEVGRRNLWGKNRSIDVFSRASLRARDIVVSDTGIGLAPTQTSYGFNEYRLYGTYREPRVFGSRSDVLITGDFEQAIRSSFNFRTRQVRAESGLRLSPKYSLAGRYSFERWELFDEHISEEDRPLVDRLFPQVRLSTLSGTVIRDTRDDLLDPSHGKWFILDGSVAARAIGSQVGFDKVYLQAFSYSRLPTTRRMVLALAGRIGAAHGFAAEAGGISIPPEDRLPASERFFAGGDTTVRGFTLDRLGNEKTITPTGFPKGGNSVVILNAELRVDMTRTIQVVGFLDGGNVFPRAVDVSLTVLRGAYGFGARYKSPLGPIRVDYGIKMDRLELSPGVLERRSVLHISIGQAF